MNAIDIKGVKVSACHGVLESEKLEPQPFIFDVAIDCDIQKAATTDDVNDTVNYAEVYALIRQQMEQPVNLLEHLAHRITKGLYAQFPQIQAVKLSVTKVTPPISGIACEGASFCLQSIRE